MVVDREPGYEMQVDCVAVPIPDNARRTANIPHCRRLALCIPSIHNAGSDFCAVSARCGSLENPVPVSCNAAIQHQDETS